MKNFFYSLICLLALFSCSGGSPENEGGNAGGNGSGGGGSQPQVKLDVTSSDFTVEGGSKLVTFTSSAAWTASVVNGRATSWCKVEPTSGAAGNASITITTTPNDTPDDRTASVVIKAGSVSKSISVSQKQKDALTVTSSKFELSSKGGEVLIEVKANVNFECEVDEASKSWITYSGTRALKTSSVVLNVSENEDLSGRSGKVYITSNGFKETVNIYQAGEKPSIVISQKEYTISSDGGTIAVDVSSNVDVEVVLPSEADWIKENATRSTSTHTYRFDVAPSEEYNQRSAEIKFINKENNLAEIVTVTQTQKDALVLAKESYTVDNEGGSLSVEIGHNVDFDVSIDVDWITQTTSRAFETSTLLFNVEANPDYDSRSGVIIFTSKDGSISQRIVVEQDGQATLIVGSKEITLDPWGGIYQFEVQTNVEFTVSVLDADWMRPLDYAARGLSYHYPQIEYDANTTYESRVGKILVTDVKNNKSDTITVTQTQNNAIVLGKDVYQIDGNGGQLQIEVRHNIDFDVQINDSWISQSTSRALETSTLVFNVEANPDNYPRWGSINLVAKDGSYVQTVIVEQAEGDYLNISCKEFYADSNSGGLWIDIQSNVPFSVSDPDVDWLRVVEQNNNSTSWYSIVVEYDANASYDPRVGKIIVTDLKNNKPDTITITQAQKEAILLSETNYKMSSKSGQLQIKVDHNVEFDVAIDVDWITLSTSRALGTSVLVFNVAENATQKDREGTITFTSKNGAVTQKVKVLQKNASFDPSIDEWEDDDDEQGGTAE